MVRVALVQVECDGLEPVAARIERVAAAVDDIAAGGDGGIDVCAADDLALGVAPDLIVLPEMWTVGAFDTATMLAHGEAVPGPTTERFASIARDRCVTIHAGAFPELTADGARFNTSVVIDAQGSIAATYRKLHPLLSPPATTFGSQSSTAHSSPTVRTPSSSLRAGLRSAPTTGARCCGRAPSRTRRGCWPSMKWACMPALCSLGGPRSSTHGGRSWSRRCPTASASCWPTSILNWSLPRAPRSPCCATDGSDATAAAPTCFHGGGTVSAPTGSPLTGRGHRANEGGTPCPSPNPVLHALASVRC
jgi:hypothetical protein